MVTESKINGTNIVFDIKTIIGFIGIAWTPAVIIGIPLLSWCSTMDHRMTIQETLNLNVTSLNETVATLKLTANDIRGGMDSMKEVVRKVESRLDILESEMRKK